MQVLDITSKHGGMDLFLFFPPIRWHYIKMFWNFAELFNIHLRYSKHRFWIKISLPFLIFDIGWVTNLTHLYDDLNIDFALFRFQRKSTDEILEDDGWIVKEEA